MYTDIIHITNETLLPKEYITVSRNNSRIIEHFYIHSHTTKISFHLLRFISDYLSIFFLYHSKGHDFNTHLQKGEFNIQLILLQKKCQEESKFKHFRLQLELDVALKHVFLQNVSTRMSGHNTDICKVFRLCDFGYVSSNREQIRILYCRRDRNS